MGRPEPRVSAAILAGGRSSRFGRDKAAVLFRGAPFIAHVARALRASCGGGLFCIGGEPRRAELLGAHHAPDLFPGEGPLGGLITALEAADTPFVFLAACDMPLLDEVLVGAIVGWLAKDDAEVFLPVGEAGAEPLCALYARSVLPAVREAFARGERRMSGFHEAVRVRRLDARELPGAAGLVSINTPEELRRIEPGPLTDDPARPPQALARRLAARITALPSDAMRRTAVLEALTALGAEQAADVLEALLTPDAPRQAQTAAAATACIHALAGGEGLPYAYAAELYQVATVKGYQAVQRLLLRPSARREASGDELAPDPRMAERTLGERKSLARKADPDVIDRLLFDPDRAVLENLLRNPRLTEREVVRIASHRPSSPDTLRRVAQDCRFGKREHVRRALVRNPYTPSELAVNLLPFLLDGELREVRSDGTLHATVREAALAILRARRAGRDKP